MSARIEYIADRIREALFALGPACSDEDFDQTIEDVLASEGIGLFSDDHLALIKVMSLSSSREERHDQARRRALRLAEELDGLRLEWGATNDDAEAEALAGRQLRLWHQLETTHRRDLRGIDRSALAPALEKYRPFVTGLQEFLRLVRAEREAEAAYARRVRLAAARAKPAPAPVSHLCSRCGRRDRHFDDLCGRCAEEAGTRPRGKVT